MRSSVEFQELLSEFPELADPNIMLPKEILARFGLLFSAYAILEAGLQNCFIYHNLVKAARSGEIGSKDDQNLLCSTLEKKAFGFTMGRLIRELRDCSELAGLMTELMDVKRKRDYFAHHFFREKNRHFGVDDNLLLMMIKINDLRKQLKALDRQCDRACIDIMNSYAPGFVGPIDIDKELEMVKRQEHDLARREPGRFGWEDY